MSLGYGVHRGLLAAGAAFVFALTCAAGARGEGEAVWRFAPALAPPPPSGVAPAEYPVPVGQVGQISFWAPNRGLLITGGEGPVEAGLYAYDGVDWHQLSTVCGGSEGRIAWAGPDEFWTISDQRGGQQLPPLERSSLRSISLCHFLDGQVVGSYAMPLGRPDSYLRMDAAACYGPSDCWFGGEVGAAPNVGAFHLHWDGSSVTAVYAPEDHAVTGMVNYQGELYESVQIRATDAFPPSPPTATTNPVVIHTIAPAGAVQAFSDLYLFPPGSGRSLPEYEHEAPPYSLEGFTLASDGSPLGLGATQLWAVANASSASSGSLTVLHCVQQACPNGEWTQVAPSAEVTLSERIVGAPAPEPGSESAWVSLNVGRNAAEVARLDATGVLHKPEILPGPQDGEVGFRGSAGPIACPAPHDCWMATEEGTAVTGNGTGWGWLFHLTDGTQLPQDTDPSFAGVITYRPPDAGVPVIYPDLPPADDSLANQAAAPGPSGPPAQTPAPPSRPKRRKPLATHVKSRFVHRRVLVVSFVLTGRARVRLVGRRGKRVVAKTPVKSLRPGRHQLSLTLDPARWPKKLQFEAAPIESSSSTAEGGSGGSSQGETIST